MPAGNRPQTSVFDCRIFKGEPKPHQLQWFGVEKRRVLMAGHFAADARLLEYVHRLQQQRTFDSQIGNDFPYLWSARKLIEGRIEIMKRVANLIDRFLLALLQSAVRTEGV